MPICAISPSDKRAQAKVVGEDLVRHYGRKKYYTVQEVKDANRRSGVNVDFCCWSHAMFNSHADFDDYHRSIGEACDYSSMKSEMLSSVSDSGDASWFDIDLSWLEFPSVDWSIFDFIDL
jgi:hypothetical protein